MLDYFKANRKVKGSYILINRINVRGATLRQIHTTDAKPFRFRSLNRRRGVVHTMDADTWGSPVESGQELPVAASDVNDRPWKKPLDNQSRNLIPISCVMKVPELIIVWIC